MNYFTRTSIPCKRIALTVLNFHHACLNNCSVCPPPATETFVMEICDISCPQTQDVAT